MGCRDCHTIFFTPMPTREEIAFFYNHDYHKDFSQSSMAGAVFAQNRYQQLQELLETHLPSIIEKPDRSLLDVGCGTGDFLKAAQQAGWNVEGTELACEAVERAALQVGGCVIQGDITTLDLPSAPYSLITSYHVIEHFLDPVQQLERCYQLLSPEGALFLETPNIDSLGARVRGAKWSHIIPPEHLIYFSPASLETAIRKAGFSKVVILTSTPQVIESVQHWPAPLKHVAQTIYDIAPKLNMGAALQAIAFKD